MKRRVEALLPRNEAYIATAPFGLPERSAQLFTAVLASLIAAGGSVAEGETHELGLSLTGLKIPIESSRRPYAGADAPEKSY